MPGREAHSGATMEICPGSQFASLTDVGLTRKRNEDSCRYWEAEDEAEFQRKGRFAAVADGMGGHEGGEHASAIAVETLSEAYRDSAAEDPAGAAHPGPRTVRPAGPRTVRPASL